MAWLAVRVFGEAVTRSGKTDVAGWRDYILSKQFGVAGFKGQAMSFRNWDRQLRQPIILTGPRSLVSMSPQEGFLHPTYLTDTLGVDEPETTCKTPG
jgi:ABC transporter substrate binding protein (PQQ-dependent alcohol dehydrogenase system)